MELEAAVLVSASVTVLLRLLYKTDHAQELEAEYDVAGHPRCSFCAVVCFPFHSAGDGSEPHVTLLREYCQGANRVLYNLPSGTSHSELAAHSTHLHVCTRHPCHHKGCRKCTRCKGPMRRARAEAPAAHLATSCCATTCRPRSLQRPVAHRPAACYAPSRAPHGSSAPHLWRLSCRWTCCRRVRIKQAPGRAGQRGAGAVRGGVPCRRRLRQPPPRWPRRHQRAQVERQPVQTLSGN